MNTILSIALLAAILILAWVIRTVAEKVLKAIGSPNSVADQIEPYGNRVRATGHRH